MVLQNAIGELSKSDSIAASHGEVVGSLVRMQASRNLSVALKNPNITALILWGAGTSYEVAESEHFKLRPEQIMQGVEIALNKEYLLHDTHGPHFTIFAGKKGAVSITVKERGHRYKLARYGATSIDIQAIARAKVPSKLDPSKSCMEFDGYATCMFDGRKVQVRREGAYPLKLECKDTDGTDGLESKARRRLASYLWSVISGEEAEHDDTETEAKPSVTVAPVPALDMPEPAMITHNDSAANVWAKERQILKSDSARTAWDAIAESKSATEVSKAVARATASVKAGTISAPDLQSLNRLAESRISELAAGVA
jgi:hypothetical protein